MVGIDTEKVLATSSLGSPESTAESTLNLRSFEYGFMPVASLKFCKLVSRLKREGHRPPRWLVSYVNRSERRTMATDHRRADAEMVQAVLLDDPDFIREMVERVLQEILGSGDDRARRSGSLRAEREAHGAP